ncbi:MAG: tRNA (N6-isopentenyl adenosine(37)-C2)-methylthiotransferase MiaB [Candidatus Fimenecus sp.]
MSKERTISEEQLKEQEKYTELCKGLLDIRCFEKKPLAFVRTYGCQGNVADGERIRGILEKIGYSFTETAENADFILFNTCAIREHAEDRLYGNVGRVKKYREADKSKVIAVCGCMAQEQTVREKLKNNYPFVNLVFGTNALWELPRLIYETIKYEKRVIYAPDDGGNIAENLPVRRDGKIKAWLPIMYGCDNFCTYCIVPYVKGRERSREPEDIISEACEIISQGYKEITLLGQNVNSYGKDNISKIDFADLLQEIADIPGDFKIRFMTSHPKDCTKKLIDTIARNEKCSKHIHLPFQSGNNRILKAMNRHYTREHYLELVKYAKERIPELVLTSDIIVGFPGETHEEFLDTLSLIKDVEYNSLFTFIFSKRPGTRAEKMEDPISREEKVQRLQTITDTQSEITYRLNEKRIGKIFKVLCEGESKNFKGFFEGRADGNFTILYNGEPDEIGCFVNVKAESFKNTIIFGKKI